MVLVDTSVWIDYFRKTNPILVDLLRENRVITHQMIIGELACGSLHQRSEILPLLQLLPLTEAASQEEALHLIEKQKLFGLGVGWVDVNLLASCMLSRSTLWTKDKNLLKIASTLGIRFAT